MKRPNLTRRISMPPADWRYLDALRGRQTRGSYVASLLPRVSPEALRAAIAYCWDSGE